MAGTNPRHAVQSEMAEKSEKSQKSNKLKARLPDGSLTAVPCDSSAKKAGVPHVSPNR